MILVGSVRDEPTMTSGGDLDVTSLLRGVMGVQLSLTLQVYLLSTF